MSEIETWISKIEEISRSGFFQAQLKQVHAKALLFEIMKDTSAVVWNYDPIRLVRNITAATLGMEMLSLADTPRLQKYIGVLRQLALAWESLSKLEEGVRKETAILNAAMMYEMAGYQANAACLAKSLELNVAINVPIIQLVAPFLRRRFVKTMLEARAFLGITNNSDAQEDLSIAGIQELARGLVLATRYFLTGDQSCYDRSIESLASGQMRFDSPGLVIESNTTHSLRSILPVMHHRTTWQVLGNLTSNPSWHRYLKLLARGIGSNILVSGSVSELWPSQLEAINQGMITQQTSKVVRMPTSAGKTRMAELAIVYTLIQNPNAKCIYVAPYRALVWELEQNFLRLFSDMGYSVSSIVGSYESDEFEELLVRESDLLIMTHEKLDLVLRANPDFLDNVRLIVLDEVQIVNEEARGIKFELLITRIRRRLSNARFLLLSAVVSHDTLEALANWLKANPETDVLESEWRPSIQRLSKFKWTSKGEGQIRYFPSSADPISEGFIHGVIEPYEYLYVNPRTGRKNRKTFPEVGNRSETAAELAVKFAQLGPVLVFCAQTNYAEGVVRSLERRFNLTEMAIQEMPNCFAPTLGTRSHVAAREWLGEEHVATKMITRGVALHHGRLPESVRKAVEIDFRQRRIPILVATNTLAQGVNLPIRTVIVHSSRRRYGPGLGEQIPSRDYWNIAGRAGRPGQETSGTIIHIVMNKIDEMDFRYFAKHRDDIESYDSALHRLLLDLLVNRTSIEDIRDMLDPEILAILVEEAGVFAEESFASSMLDETLTSLQVRSKGKDLTELQRVFATRAREVLNEIPDETYLGVYSSTGLSLKSCESIRQFVVTNEGIIHKLLTELTSESLLSLAAIVLGPLQGLPEMETRTKVAVSQSKLLKLWLAGTRVDAIAAEFRDDDVNTQKLTKFIEEYFGYVIPWGVSGLIKIACKVLKLEREDLSKHSAFFGSMVKYGVPTPEGTWAMLVGIPFRELAIRVSDEYIKSGRESSFRDFREWLLKIDSERFKNELGVEDIILEDVARALFGFGVNPLLEQHKSISSLLPYREWVVGIRHKEERISTARKAEIGQKVTLARDYENRFDHNAVLVLLDGNELGYLSRNLAQLAAPDIDVGTELTGEIVQFVLGDVPQIQIHIKELERSEEA